MGHGLVEVNGKIPAAYANERAWHSLGTVVEGLMTAADVREHAGIDFEVIKSPVYVRQDGAFVEVGGHVATRRADTGDVLGMVSPHYGVMQSGVMLDFLDGLVQDAGMRYQSAGALYGGRQVWILATLGDEWTIGESRHVPYILATTTHDGSGSVTVTPTTVNVVCANTLSAALATGDSQRINVRHTSGVVDQLRAREDVLRVATADQRRLQEYLQRANETPVTGEQVAEVARQLFGERPSGELETPRRVGAYERKVAGFKRVASEELGRSPNAFGLIQTITGYADHLMRPESKADLGPDRAFASEWGGQGAKFKTHALGVMRDVVPGLELATV